MCGTGRRVHHNQISGGGHRGDQSVQHARHLCLTALPYILTFRSNDAATHRVGHRTVLQPGLHRVHLIKVAAQRRLSHRNALVDKDFGQL